ncbi:MAG: hypothetical protein JNG85_14210 [Spirochaetaceae bacterium]|nr:hypothetical protein [Spirochaetaceae bacterium]
MEPGKGVRPASGGQRPGSGGKPSAPGGGDGSDEGKDRRRFGRRRFGRPGQDRSKDDRPREERAKDGRGPDARDDRARGDRAKESQFREPIELPPNEKSEPVDCPLCGKPVYDLSTAVGADKENAVPAHFDCVLERVAAAESLGPNERLVYLGSGSFGVVEFKDKNESAFVVKRRVQWEKEGEKKDWRRGLSSRISKI